MPNGKGVFKSDSYMQKRFGVALEFNFPNFCCDNFCQLYLELFRWQQASKFLFNLGFGVRTKRCHQGNGCCGKGAKQGNLNILLSLLASHLYGKELLMGKTNLASSIHHVNVRQRVESNVLVIIMEPAVKSIVGMSIFI